MSIIGYSFTNKNGKTKWMCVTLDRETYETFDSGVRMEITERPNQTKYKAPVDCKAITETFTEAKARVDDLIKVCQYWDICDSPVLQNGLGYYYLEDKRIWKLFNTN